MRTFLTDLDNEGIKATITGLFRTEGYNKSLKGSSPNSYHLDGLGVDIGGTKNNKSIKQIKEYVDAGNTVTVDGITYKPEYGYHGDHFHLELEPQKAPASPIGPTGPEGSIPTGIEGPKYTPQAKEDEGDPWYSGLTKASTDFITENIPEDVVNVLENPNATLKDNAELALHWVQKQTGTGLYSEEAVKAEKLKVYKAKQKKYQEKQKKLKDEAAERERKAIIDEQNRQENLIFLKDIQVGETTKTHPSGHQVKSAVVDLGTSAERPGVKFGIGHNYKVDGYKPNYYKNQPNIDVQNSRGIIGAFHHKFVPYEQTANNKFEVPVQLAWNQETGVFTAKKTEDLLPNDLVVPYRGGSNPTGNITRLKDLDIKKLKDGSFDITTGGKHGMDTTNGTSTIKKKSGKHFHIGIDWGEKRDKYGKVDYTTAKGKERVINSKDLNQYRSLRGGMVVIFDNEAEVSVMVTGSVNKMFQVVNELQKKYPNKEWNIAKGDTGTYAVSAFNPEGKGTTTVKDFASYSNQNTYGESQYLVLLEQAQEEAKEKKNEIPFIIPPEKLEELVSKSNKH